MSAGAEVELRRYRPSDGRELAELFYNTVHTVNARDYTPVQLDAWAPRQRDLEAWNRSFLRHETLVAVEGDCIVGFGDLDTANGYLDRLYVRLDRQGRGIGTALCDALEAAAVTKHVVTHASITARPFFARRGYAVLRTQQVVCRGVEMINFVMEKQR